MIKLENTDVFNFEGAIRGMYDGKGVRKVYPSSYEAYVSSHGTFLSCGTYATEEEARNAVIITNSENTIHSFKKGLQKKIHNQYGTYEVKKYVD